MAITSKAIRQVPMYESNWQTLLLGPDTEYYQVGITSPCICNLSAQWAADLWGNSAITRFPIYAKKKNLKRIL